MLAAAGPGTQARLGADNPQSSATTGKLSTQEAAVRTTRRGRPVEPAVVRGSGATGMLVSRHGVITTGVVCAEAGAR